MVFATASTRSWSGAEFGQDIQGACAVPDRRYVPRRPTYGLFAGAADALVLTTVEGWIQDLLLAWGTLVLTQGADRHQSMMDVGPQSVRILVSRRVYGRTGMGNELSRGVDTLPGLVGTALADNTLELHSQPLSGIITNAGISLWLFAGDPPEVDGAREAARRTSRDATGASDVIARLRALFGKKRSGTESGDLNEGTRGALARLSTELERGRVNVRDQAGRRPPACRR